MQECFTRAILSLPDEHTNMRAWLYRVARNLLYDEIRRPAPVPLPDREAPGESAPDPLEEILNSDLRRAMMRKISELDRRKREVLTLQYFSGLNQKEISRLLGMSHENVRVLSLRARRELKRKLEEDGYAFS